MIGLCYKATATFTEPENQQALQQIRDDTMTNIAAYKYFDVKAAIKMYDSRDYSAIQHEDILVLMERLKGMQTEMNEEKTKKLIADTKQMTDYLNTQMDFLESNRYYFVIGLTGFVLGSLVAFYATKISIAKSSPANTQRPKVTDDEYDDIVKQESLIQCERDKLEKILEKLKSKTKPE